MELSFRFKQHAIRFTDAGYVHVKLSYRYGETQPMLQLSVTDTGTGMPASYLQHLFEPFIQADGSTTRRFGGTGLGLSIVKRLVDLMHGKIAVASVLNQGTRVEITLPMSWGELRELPSTQFSRLGALGKTAVIAVGSPIFPAINAWLIHMGISRCNDVAHANWTITESVEHKLILSYAGAEIGSFVCTSELPSLIQSTCQSGIPQASDNRATTPAKSTEIQAKDIRMILAEDNDINRDIIAQQLLLLGISPRTACDGLDALEQWRQNRPTIMLIDCQMPKMDGYELTRQIRSAETGEDIHTLLIAITANASVTDERDCLAAGMDDFLSKPLTRQKLDTMLRKWKILSADPSTNNRT